MYLNLWRIEDLDDEFNHKKPKFLLQELRFEFLMIKSRSKWNSITGTLSSEFNFLRIAKKIKTEEKENCAWINRKCKENFYLIWNNAQRRQRIELAITECTKNEDSELARLWYHVRIQALIQSSSMEESNQTMRERWENCINLYW